MTNPLAAADFFALEAGECLDRLETLVGRPDGPPADEFLRTARVLRGSALMACQQPIARAAAGLEGLARAYRDGRRPWDPATREQAAQAVEEFRLLVRRVREWGEPETARAVRLGLSLESLAGRTTGAGPAGEPGRRRNEQGELNTGVRAFVAREGALIASALDRAARALHGVARRPRAALHRHPPHAVAPRTRRAERAGAAARDPRWHRARRGRPHPAVRAAARRGRGDGRRVRARSPASRATSPSTGAPSPRPRRPAGSPTSCSAPSPSSATSCRSSRSTTPTTPRRSRRRSPSRSSPRPRPLGPLELVSHGEHLCQSADLIARSRSAIERDLRLYHLLGSLRAAGTPGPDPVASALVVFARSAREALAAGVAAARDAGAGELPARSRRAAPRSRRRRRPDADLPPHPGRRLPARRAAPGRGRPASCRRAGFCGGHLPGPDLLRNRSRQIVPIESLLYDGHRCPSSRCSSRAAAAIESLLDRA